MTRRPRDRHRAIGRCGELKCVRPIAGPGHARGRKPVDAQVSGIHTEHRFAEPHLDAGQLTDRGAGSWADRCRDRRDRIRQRVLPGAARAEWIESLGRAFKIRDAVRAVPADIDRAFRWWDEGEGVIAAGTTDARGGNAIDEQVGRAHAEDGIGEAHADRREAGEISRRRQLAENDRRRGDADGDVDHGGGGPGPKAVRRDGAQRVAAWSHAGPTEREG